MKGSNGDLLMKLGYLLMFIFLLPLIADELPKELKGDGEGIPPSHVVEEGGEPEETKAASEEPVSEPNEEEKGGFRRTCLRTQ